MGRIQLLQLSVSVGYQRNAMRQFAESSHRRYWQGPHAEFVDLTIRVRFRSDLQATKKKKGEKPNDFLQNMQRTTNFYLEDFLSNCFGYDTSSSWSLMMRLH